MEIASDYPNLQALQEDISILFCTDLVCRLNLPLEGIRLAVEFFVSNWTVLKRHSAPVIVASCLLSAGYMTHSSTKRTLKILRDTFEISLNSIFSCLYDILRSRGIPVTYTICELSELIRTHRGDLIQC